ncbi:MAG: hypothetical protein ACXWQO_14595 [Bdellovibrionota bacterium]
MKVFGWGGLIVLAALLAAFFLLKGGEHKAPEVIAEEISSEPKVESAVSKTAVSPAPSTQTATSTSHATTSEPSAYSPAPTANSAAQKPAPLKDVLLRDPQGNFPFAGMPEAIAACEERGMKLPTIRELAQLAQTRGAKGILELSEAHGDVPEGYKSIRVLDGGSVDEFYYNSAGYQDSTLALAGKFNLVGMNAGEHEIMKVSGKEPEGFLIYWSSSEAVGHHTESDPDLHSFYVLDVHGKIHDHYRSVKGLVRCIAKQ